MRIGWIVLIVLLIFPLVKAGEGRTFILNFDIREDYNLWLAKSDRILLEYGGYNHTIIIDDIKNNTVELDVFLFLERGPHTPYYAYLAKEHDLRLDFDKDGKKELNMDLLRVESEKGKVNMGFKKLKDWDTNKIIEFKEEEPSKNLGLMYYMGIIIVLFLSSIFLIRYYLKKNNQTYF